MNFFLATMPKAGTHFLAPVISQVLQRQAVVIGRPQIDQFINAPGDDLFAYGHIRFADCPALATAAGWKVIALIRDPRDVVLSYRDFLERSHDPRHQAAFAQLARKPLADQHRMIIDGFKSAESDYGIPDIEAHCSGWLEWADRGGLLVRYEQIGTSASNQSLADFLGVAPTAVGAAVAVCRGTSKTMNVGRAGRWRSQLDGELLAYLCARTDIVRCLGYD